MRIKFWGTRGSVPTPGPATIVYGGNTPCLEARTEKTLIILDAGSGIRELGRSLMTEFAGRPIEAHLFLSHTHWDHIQGIPFFSPAFVEGNKLNIYGCEGAHGRLRQILAGQMVHAYFPVPLDAMRATQTYREIGGGELVIGDVSVQSTFLNHPGLSLGYRLQSQGKVMVYLTDHELIAPGSVPSHQLLPSDDNLKRPCIGQPNTNLPAFAAEADLLITDAQYTVEEYPRKKGWGHSTTEAAVQLSMEAKVKQLVLFHHDPEHDDQQIDRMVAHARDLLREANSESPTPDHCCGAREGVEFIL